MNQFYGFFCESGDLVKRTFCDKTAFDHPASAGKIYIRDSDKEIVSIFRDAFYIYLTKQDNASCRKALAVIEMLRDEVKEAKAALTATFSLYTIYR